MKSYYQLQQEKKASKSRLNNAKMMYQATQNLEFELYVSDKKSIFREVKSLSVGDELQNQYKKLAKLYLGANTIYSNLENKEHLIQRKIGDSIFYAKIRFKDFKWKLTKESRRIENHICYKAVTVKKTPNGEHKIIAWYSPDFPISLGPTNYAGQLPGLILELHDILGIYRVKKIVTNPKFPKDIKWPKKEEIISQEDYKKQSDKLNDFFIKKS